MSETWRGRFSWTRQRGVLSVTILHHNWHNRIQHVSLKTVNVMIYKYISISKHLSIKSFKFANLCTWRSAITHKIYAIVIFIVEILANHYYHEKIYLLSYAHPIFGLHIFFSHVCSPGAIIFILYISLHTKYSHKLVAKNCETMESYTSYIHAW